MSDTLTQLQTHPIRFEDAEAIEAIRRREGHKLSAHAFSSLFLWKDYMNLSISLTENAFFVHFGARGENAWFFPCGESEEKTVFLQKLCNSPNASLHYLREEDVTFLEECCPGAFEIRPARDDEEYLYLRHDQIALEGRLYKNLRRKVNCGRRLNLDLIPLSLDNIDAAVQVVNAWAEQKNLPGDGDRAVALRMLDNFEQLKIQGVLLFQGDEPQALAAGSLISEDTFDLHINKTLISDLGKYLLWELFSRLPENVVWINQEEDLGIEGLRINKEDSVPTKRALLWKAVLR